ncbi:hypothetical protein [Streptomyces muensis]|uniref:Lipoprotein n=1 Tax=Streptomyces muensis TaxID=1077944 RepID=A0A9X1TIH3_STRM4|nr:hypothetical protein [Streptomyces muensis]MCF1593651.1 hypothetical protein [Streptomyces muensis]
MRTIPLATALACLLTGVALTGCGAGGGSAEKSAADLLDEANDTMSALRFVTIEMSNTPDGDPDGTVTSRLRTDLKDRCTAKTTFAENGSLEQIRIGETDYVRPDETYLEKWSGRPVADVRPKQWAKVPASEARPGEGLAACTWTFESFGTAKKGAATRVGDREAIAVHVTDKADTEGTYTFYVATEGKPYLLKTVYKGGGNVTTTSFSAFDEPVDVRPPAAEQVVDKADIED